MKRIMMVVFFFTDNLLMFLHIFVWFLSTINNFKHDNLEVICMSNPADL